MASVPLKIETQTPDFFRIPPAKLEIETVPETGRTYFIHKGAIVAVARPARELGVSA